MSRQRIACFFATPNWLAAFAFAALTIGPPPQMAWSDEPAEAFIEGLINRGYHDVALEYLETIGDNPAVSESVKETVVYQRGLILIDQARLQRDPAMRAAIVKEAEECFEAFAKEHPDHPLAIAADTELGNVLLEQARYRIHAAKSDEENRDRLLEEGRDFYDRATQFFTARQETIRARLIEIGQVEPTDTELLEERDKYRGEYIQVQVDINNIIYEKAESYELGSEENQELLTEAAAGYLRLSEIYRRRGAGLIARLYLGHCKKDLGEYENAIFQYDVLLRQNEEEEPAYRPFRVKAMGGSLECWIAMEEYDLAIENATRMLNRITRQEEEDPSWLALKYQLALAYKLKGDFIGDEGSARDRNEAYQEAKIQAIAVSRVRSEFQARARELLESLDGGTAGSESEGEPENFAEARDAGRAALVTSEEIDSESGNLEEKIAHLIKARDYLNLALAFAEEEITVDDVNFVRYFLCYVHFKIAILDEQGEDSFYDAALLGEFLANRYPDFFESRQAAAIAAEAYKALFYRAPEEDNQFEIAGIIRLAEYIADAWPDEPETQKALDTLVTFMVHNGRAEEAETYLLRINENSPQRGQAEIKVGNAVWRSYRDGMGERRIAIREGNGNDPNIPTENDLALLRGRAVMYLEQGIGRLNNGSAPVEVDGDYVDALTALTEVKVDSGEVEEALTFLEDENQGLLALLKNQHPATQRRNVDVNVYNVALRAYITAIPETDNEATRQARLDTATAIMDALNDVRGDTPEGNRYLLSVYLSLASDISDQFAAEEDHERRVAMAQAFDAFLARIVVSPSAGISQKMWAGQAYRNLGESFDQAPNADTDTANTYYNRSVTIFSSLIDSVSEERKPQVLLRLAQTHRRLRRYEEAIEAYADILRGNPVMLNVQIDAAQTYEEWGIHAEEKNKLIEAINGSHPGDENENIIWGWAKLQSITSQNRENRYVDEFYRARYRLSSCRFHIGILSEGAEKNQSLDRAIREIMSLHSLFLEPGLESDDPALRDPTRVWHGRIESLLKKIQQERNVPETGFSASHRFHHNSYVFTNTFIPLGTI